MAFVRPFSEALRQRRRDWRVTLGFCVVLGSALALAIVCLSVAWPVLHEPLPFPTADRLYAVRSVVKGETGGISWRDADDLRERVASIERIAVYSTRTWGVQTEREGHVEVLLSAMATGEFFEALGVPGAKVVEGEAWLTHAGAARLFGAPERAPHRTIWINAAPHRVAGVLPGSFRLPLPEGAPELVLALTRADYCCERGGVQKAIAVTRSPERFEAELAAASRSLAEEYAATNRDRRFVSEPFRSQLFGARAAALRWMLGGAFCLVLIAAANASGMWLARWTRRSREMTIRMALGARAVDLAAMRAAEGAVAGLAAGAAGTLLAAGLLLLFRSTPVLRDQLEAFAVWRPVGLLPEAVAIAVATGAIAGVATALLPHPAATRRLRIVAMAVQLALTTVLAWTTVALGENAHRLLTAPRGFSADSTLIAGIGIPEARYDSDEKMIGFHDAAVERLRSIPGVSAAAGGVGVPQGGMRTRFLRDGQTLARDSQPTARIGIASRDLLPMLGVPVLKGRGFTAEDRWSSPRVALVNEAFVRAQLGGADPLREGLRLSFYNGFAMKPYTRFQVVGVIADTRNDAMVEAAQPQVLIPAEQIAMEGFFYLVKTARPAGSLQSELREAIWRVDPAIQRVTFRPLEEYLGRGLADRRALAGFGILLFCAAGLIVGAGLYATLSAAALESRREMAVKAAIGASPTRLALELLRWALWSIGLGGVASAAAIPFVAASVHLERAVLAPMPVNVVLTVAAMAAITVAAALRPVSRAAMVSPAEVIRDTFR